MMKSLRLAFVALLAAVCGSALAADIEFIPAQTKAGAEATSVTVDGVTISVSGGTMNRDDNYRCYKGQTLTITSTTGQITNVVFSCTASDDAQYGPGNFTDATSGSYTYEGTTGQWEGQAGEFSLTASGAQVRMTKIVVTTDGEVGPGDDDDDEFSIDYETGSVTETDNQIVLNFTGKAQPGNVSVTGQMVFDFADNLCTKAVLALTYPTPEIAQVAYQYVLADAEDEGFDEVSIEGSVVTAVANTYFKNYTKAMVRVMLGILMDNDSLSSGTLDDPLSAVEANVLYGITLDSGETTDEPVYIKGKISSIKYSFDTDHGTATFYISEDGTATDQFYVYGTYYLENKPWTDGYTQIKEGDDVIVYGKVTNFRGTIETASKQSFIYSLNGQTQAEGTETPEPEPQNLKFKKASEVVSGQSYLIASGNKVVTLTTSNYGYLQVTDVEIDGDIIRQADASNAFTIEATDGGYTFKQSDGRYMYQTGNYNSFNFSAEPTEGQVWTIDARQEGNFDITNKMTNKWIQYSERYTSFGCYADEQGVMPELYVLEEDAEGIVSLSAGTAAEGLVYNLSGQQVGANYKGLVIKNGKKMLVK